MQTRKDYILSLDADKRLFHADMLVDKAHVVMLREKGILKRNDAAMILNCLNKIDPGYFVEHVLPTYEDVHTAIESVLIKEVGADIGGRMHTGRSRNDEVATCIRLALRDGLLVLMEEVNELRRAAIEKADMNVETIMPGYTHLQHAQPTTFAHHFLAHADAFARDFSRLKSAYEGVNVSPLGAAAFASTGFPIDRDRTAYLLGFDSVLENSMDAVSTRDFAIEAISCYANLMTNLSRLAEEIILWSTSEFNLVRVAAEYAAGSSIMPQKRNPDYAELVRARTGSVYGCLMSAISICKALPYAYNRDLQEVTPHLLKATEITLSSVSVLSHIVEGLELKREEMVKKAQMGFTTATELADTIVRETGVPFRTAHKIVSSLAKKLEDSVETTEGSVVLREMDDFAILIIGEKLSKLGLTEKEVDLALDIASNIEMRIVTGGPASKEIQRMLRTRRMGLERDEKIRVAKEERVIKSLEELRKEVKKKTRVIKVIKKSQILSAFYIVL
ncbi:MAG: argininosuccinate lyase [Halobacteriota archaeon]